MKSEEDIKTGPEPAKGRMFSEFEPPSYEEWVAEAKRLLKGISFEKKMFTQTVEGITLKPIYRKEDISGLWHIHSPCGFPPYLRGNQAIYRDAHAWEIAQEINYPDLTAFNSAIRHDLERGLTAITIPLDTAAKFGLDSENTQNLPAGDGGLSVFSLSEFEAALDGVDLSRFPLFIDCGISGLPFLGFYAKLAEKNGINPNQLRGSIAMDPLGLLVSNGKLTVDIESLYDELADITKWASDNAPNIGTIHIHGETYNNGGANAVQELAYVMATAVEYMRALEKRGIDPETSVPHFRFSFGMGANFFMETAKLRAARLIWHKITEACGMPEEKRKMHIHARTSNYTKTFYDPFVNMLRATTETFSAIAGGADSVHSATFDEQIRPSDEFARRIARNVQLILKEESHLAQIMDPAGGSWYIEKLTDDIAEKTWEQFAEIEKTGGMYKALLDGFPQSEVAKIAEQRAKAYASRKSSIIGTNKYPNTEEQSLDLHPFDYGEFKKTRINDLKELSNAVNEEDRTALSNKIKDGSFTEAVIDAVSNNMPLSEILKIIRQGKEPSASITRILPLRVSQDYERLRLAVEKHREEKGGMKVFLATLGPVRKYMPRLDFAASFFEVGGFEVIRTMGYDSSEEATNAAFDEDANVVVICGLDDSYPDMAPVAATVVKKKKPDAIVIMAGMPPDDDLKKKYGDAGVDDFIHLKSNTLKTLIEIASKLGVTL
ncbi:MAG: methylmalonyl-CoA mutase [candidate division Zixibacteria bacterium]|nr:methylmalonyl-CoA mutase [candidate division Zixibacteria bacterium]